MLMSPPEQVFLLLLSSARHGTERAARFYEEISHYSPYADVKDMLHARALIASKTVAVLDDCFRLMRAAPVRHSGRVEEVFADDFRRELIELQSPAATALFILAKATHLQNFRTGEYVALAASADLAGHPEIAALLERCLAEYLTSMERTRGMIRDAVAERIAQKSAA
jgi:ferritin-like metal-binding protein YciE